MFQFPEIPKLYKLGIKDEPLRITPDDISKIIIAFSKNKDKIKKEVVKIDKLEYISKEEKNKINNLSKDYFERIKEDSLPYFKSIDDFLKDPINDEYSDYYMDFTIELNSKIIAERHEFEKFEQIINKIYDYVLENDYENQLVKKKRFIYLFLHYMYYNCDIGKKNDIKAN